MRNLGLVAQALAELAVASGGPAARLLSLIGSGGGGAPGALVNLIAAPAGPAFQATGSSTEFRVFLIDTTAGPVAVAAPIAPALNDTFTIKNVVDSGNGITVTPAVGTIDGAGVFIFPGGVAGSMRSATFAWDGVSNWNVIWTFRGGISP